MNSNGLLQPNTDGLQPNCSEMVSNLIAMASNPGAMAFNLTNSNGLQPNRDGVQPNRENFPCRRVGRETWEGQAGQAMPNANVSTTGKKEARSGRRSPTLKIPKGFLGDKLEKQEPLVASLLLVAMPGAPSSVLVPNTEHSKIRDQESCSASCGCRTLCIFSGWLDSEEVKDGRSQVPEEFGTLTDCVDRAEEMDAFAIFCTCTMNNIFHRS